VHLFYPILKHVEKVLQTNHSKKKRKWAIVNNFKKGPKTYPPSFTVRYRKVLSLQVAVANLLKQSLKRLMAKNTISQSSVSDPDPCRSVLKWLHSIQIWIRIGNSDSGYGSRTVNMASTEEKNQISCWKQHWPNALLKFFIYKNLIFF